MSRTIERYFLHTKCRNTAKPYLRSDIFRQLVPDDKVPWTVPFPTYNPTDYTSSYLVGKEWADWADPTVCAFNTVDGKLNRVSHHSAYLLDNGRPLNPFGRTGLCGRGTLGRWGPNHAADPIISRFHNNKLQFVGIQRKDTDEWAIPGGMVDVGEDPAQTFIREFTEEALDNNTHMELQALWQNSTEIYKGYVDDPRNTDNAWMETIVANFHDDNGLFEKISLKAGDDAKNVKWITVESRLSLYASHRYFIKLFAQLHEIFVL